MEKKPTRSCLESFRHPHWDYSAAAAYFITIDTANMAHYFGHVTDGVMRLNQIGQLVQQIWLLIPEQFAFVRLGAHIVMPNHMHGIIQIEATPDHQLQEHVIAEFSVPTAGKIGGITGIHNPMLHQNLGRVVRWFKGRSTCEIRKTGFEFAWHSRYYDRIILNAEIYDRVTAYIEDNPRKWEEFGTR